MTRQQLIRLVRQLAPRMKLDARAVLSVGHAESGLRPGAVGDGGTSFGPFQLHEGGALPAGRGRQWASSPAGVRYALRQMSQVAGGLHGQQAVDAIVRRFERPADPSGEITRAMSVYGRMPAGQAGRRMTAPGVGRGNPQAARQAAARFQNALQIAMSGGDVQQAWNQLARAAGQMQAIRWGGTIEQPPAWQRSGPPGSSSATVNRALQVAHAQLGKPYVWGGESPGEGGFDCSGLIDFALRQAGVDVPGRLTTQSALTLGKPVNLKNLRPGDMIITNGGKHMVWYVGGGRVIAAPRSGEVVQYQPLKDHIAGIVGIRRLPI